MLLKYFAEYLHFLKSREYLYCPHIVFQILVVILKQKKKVTDIYTSFCFTVQAENKDALYFVGLFRVANIEFLPEFRQKESREFFSVAQNVQQVVRNILTYCTCIQYILTCQFIIKVYELRASGQNFYYAIVFLIHRMLQRTHSMVSLDW